jgi:hypothetical protein
MGDIVLLSSLEKKKNLLAKLERIGLVIQGNTTIDDTYLEDVVRKLAA